MYMDDVGRVHVAVLIVSIYPSPISIQSMQESSAPHVMAIVMLMRYGGQRHRQQHLSDK